MARDNATLQRYDPGDETKNESPEITHTIGFDKPISFSVMRDLRAAGLKILDPQTGHELHALINLHCFGLTRKTTKNNNGHVFGFVTSPIAQQPLRQFGAVLIDKKQLPYDIEAMLYLHGPANWTIEANVDFCWVLIVTDAIDVDDYSKIIIPIVARYSVDLFVTPLLCSFEDGVRIDLTTVTSGVESGSSPAVSKNPLPKEEE